MTRDMERLSGPWRIDERVAWQIVGGEAVLLDLGAGRAIGLNAAGSFVWRLVESAGEEDIVRAVAERFHVEAESARIGVIEFLGVLHDRGLIAEADSGRRNREPLGAPTNNTRGDAR